MLLPDMEALDPYARYNNEYYCNIIMCRLCFYAYICAQYIIVCSSDIL